MTGTLVRNGLNNGCSAFEKVSNEKLNETEMLKVSLT